MKRFFCLTLLAGWAHSTDLPIDVGHSDKRPGAMSASGRKDLDLNRVLAQEIAGAAKAAGFSYRLIGDDGKMDVLTDRTITATSEKLFLSIHHDSIPTEWFTRVQDFSGFSLFVSRKNVHIESSLDCAKKLGARLIAAGFKPSRYHALPIKGQDRPFADEQMGVHYFDDLIVLKTAAQPAVLIEAGVIVNPNDEEKVTGPMGRKLFAEAVEQGIRAYFSR